MSDAMTQVVRQLIDQIQHFLARGNVEAARRNHAMIYYREDQYSVLEWVRGTFGLDSSPMAVAVRTQKEMVELLEKIEYDADPDEIAEECADVAIMIMQLCSKYNRDLRWAVDRKMEKNRGRRWSVNEKGIAQHVPETVDAGDDRV